MFKKPKEKIFEFKIRGIELKVVDFETSLAPKWIANELEKNRYGIENINFEPEDVVIDIGAHIGMVSIYLGKKFPFLKIYSFEPIPDNYKHFLKNIKINNVNNIDPFNLAVTADGRNLPMIVNFFDNSGGATACLRNMRLPGHFRFVVKSVTLDDIFERHKIKKCRLLKIDCEGCEHEVLTKTTVLPKIEHLSGEFHINERLRSQGYSSEALMKRCQKFISPRRLNIKIIKMAD